jgi:hypothetical protein
VRALPTSSFLRHPSAAAVRLESAHGSVPAQAGGEP